MDVLEAIQLLRAYGLMVRTAPGPRLYAFADPSDTQLVDEAETACRFSVSVSRSSQGWVVRSSEADTEEEVSDLAAAMMRAGQAFSDYRELHSPKVYGDQFARFESVEPLTAIESALVDEGWRARNAAMEALGLTFVRGASFRIDCAPERRIVLVVVNPTANENWRLSIRCYRQSQGPGRSEKIPIRGHQPDGAPIPDGSAPHLSYQVASVLHVALVGVASHIMWAVHDDPICGRSSPEPLPPV